MFLDDAILKEVNIYFFLLIVVCLINLWLYKMFYKKNTKSLEKSLIELSELES